MATLLVCMPVQAGGVPVPGLSAARSVPVTSLREARFRRTVAQQYDFSCGAAAVATLLTHHYHRPTPESEVFRVMWRAGDRTRIREVGFSLLDMKRFLESIGLQADGYRVGLDQLAQARLAAIALIDVGGYRHFVVIAGLSDQQVLLADPAQGTRVRERRAFEQIRSDVLLLVRPEPGQPPPVFAHDLRPERGAPLLWSRERRSLGAMFLLLPQANEF